MSAKSAYSRRARRAGKGTKRSREPESEIDETRYTHACSSDGAHDIFFCSTCSSLASYPSFSTARFDTAFKEVSELIAASSSYEEDAAIEDLSEKHSSFWFGPKTPEQKPEPVVVPDGRVAFKPTKEIVYIGGRYADEVICPQALRHLADMTNAIPIPPDVIPARRDVSRSCYRHSASCNCPSEDLSMDVEDSSLKTEGKRTIRALFVGNVASTKSDMLSILASLDAQVTSVLDGRECLDSVRQSRYDFILLDSGAPGVNVCDVARRLRSMESIGQLPLRHRIVALTDPTIALDETRLCVEAGVDAFATKPCTHASLKALFSMHTTISNQSPQGSRGDSSPSSFASMGGSVSCYDDTCSNMMMTDVTWQQQQPIMASSSLNGMMMMNEQHVFDFPTKDLFPISDDWFNVLNA